MALGRLGNLSKVMRDLSKNDPARMVRYVRRFGHLWLAQRHPKPSLADDVGLVTISIVWLSKLMKVFLITKQNTTEGDGPAKSSGFSV
jgi:hypothetical protein